MTQDDSFPHQKHQEEEELEYLLASLSPLTQAKERVMGSLITEESQSDTPVGKITRKAASYSRHCKDYLKDIGQEYPRLSKLGLQTLEIGGIALEGALIVGSCSGPQSIFLCLGSVGFVAANHSGVTSQAFEQMNRGVAWGLEQGGAHFIDVQEIAPWLSGGMLMIAGGKVVNLSNLEKKIGTLLMKTSIPKPLSKPKNVVDKTSFSINSKIILLERRGFVMFDGVEFRAVRDLGHLDSQSLLDIYRTGKAPKDIHGNPLRGHHHLQRSHRETGAFIVEMPDKNHKVNNILQHPFGNKKGHGLSLEERADWNKLRTEFHKERARQELIKRGLLNE